MLTDAHVHFFPELLTHTPPFPGWDPRQIHLNATQEADREAVAQVTRRAPNVPGFPEVVPYFGIHPWYVADLSDGWEDRLSAALDQFPAAGVGEIGLDALRPDLELQKKVFLAQLELAVALKRPVSIHCVRAWEWVEPLIQRTVGPAGLPILLHGFNGSADQALHFIEGLGWNVSFSLTSIRTRLNSPKTRGLLERLPPDRVLLETDAETLDQTQGFREFCQAVETLRRNGTANTANH
ncbi:MAG: TatD family hydrolase [Thermoguttaceae bacterium]|nr:TatD family hydrolase [Thermoguttaceae bacterium]